MKRKAKANADSARVSFVLDRSFYRLHTFPLTRGTVANTWTRHSAGTKPIDSHPILRACLRYQLRTLVHIMLQLTLFQTPFPLELYPVKPLHSSRSAAATSYMWRAKDLAADIRTGIPKGKMGARAWITIGNIFKAWPRELGFDGESEKCGYWYEMRPRRFPCSTS